MLERSWPLPTLTHVLRLTDDCGMIQHAKFWLPDYATGYCVDDNSRALIVAQQYCKLFDDATAHQLMVRYLAFIRYVQREDGKFRNFVGYHRMYLEENGSPDSLGRTIWALGRLGTTEEAYLAVPAHEMLKMAMNHVTPRFPLHSIAYTLLGITALAEREEWQDEARRLAQPLAARLLTSFRTTNTSGWSWYLPELTYGNSRLAEAMLRASVLMNDAELLQVGLQSLDFLNSVCYRDGYLSVVGCQGWYPRGGECALFDQQPIDAGGMVEVNLLASQLTGHQEYFEKAVTAMDWFYGRNLVQVPLYDDRSGGCHDGLHATGTNANQGAESTLVYLLAQLGLYKAAPHLFEISIPDITPLDDEHIRGNW